MLTTATCEYCGWEGHYPEEVYINPTTARLICRDNSTCRKRRERQLRRRKTKRARR